MRNAKKLIRWIKNKIGIDMSKEFEKDNKKIK